MKKIFSILLTVACFSAYAQSDVHCASDQIMGKHYAAHPELKEQKKARDLALKTSTANKTQGATYTIPVVFHILHQGGPENISDYQVYDAMRILNEDYAKMNGDFSDVIPSFQSVAANTNIQFALATKDPNGNCTNGIVHYYDTDADWYDTSVTTYSHSWNSTQYMNVYVVRKIILSSGFGAAGYAYFPGSWPDGDNHDAIVLLNNYFGSIGTGSRLQSRVLTHEVGHWLNLYHVFDGVNPGSGDCNSNDQVDDTPTTTGYIICPDKNVPSSYQFCSPGVDENFQNYMDYSYCTRMFTAGQGVRMQATLESIVAGRNNLWSSSNLIVTGVTNPTSACVPNADFHSNRTVTCAGTPVRFSDASWGARPTSYSWSFPGGTPATSTDSMPVVVYNTPGKYTVTHSSSTAAGTSTPITKTDFITVTNNVAQYDNNWVDSFESSDIPNSDWSVSNSSGGANWQRTTDAAYNGLYAVSPLASDLTRKSVTSMISPSIETSREGQLSFKMATAESNPDHINTLKVYYSTDCGNTWVEGYSKTGAALITSNRTDNPFIPVDQSEWRYEFVDLPKADYISYKFSYIRDTLPGASNIFIDDIALIFEAGVDPITANFDQVHLFPNPAKGFTTLTFELQEKHNVKIYLNDMLGRTVEVLANTALVSGTHQFKIGENKKLSSGIYFINMNIDGQIISKKLLVE